MTIDDHTVSSQTTYSSAKISQLLDQYAVLNDNLISNQTTYSSLTLEQMLNGEATPFALSGTSFVEGTTDHKAGLLVSADSEADGDSAGVFASAAGRSAHNWTSVIASVNAGVHAPQSAVLTSNSVTIEGGSANTMASTSNSFLDATSSIMMASNSNQIVDDEASVSFSSILSNRSTFITSDSQLHYTTILSSDRLTVETEEPYNMIMGDDSGINVRLTNEGSVESTQGTSTIGADYAEYMENLIEEEIPVGSIVTPEKSKIRKATQDDQGKPLFVVSAHAAVTANDNIRGSKIERDEYGRITSKEPDPNVKSKSEDPKHYSLVAFVGIVYVNVAEDIDANAYVSSDGKQSDERTNLYCLEMTGDGIAKCILR